MTVHSMSSVRGHQVIALDTAEQIGTVKHFVVSQAGDRIERIHIDGRKKNSVFSDWDMLESFGDDRVMIKREDAGDRANDDRDIDVAKGSIDILGSRILDTAGFEHGKVADVDFDADTGAIVTVRADNGQSIPVSAVRSLGSYALVVDA